MDGEAEGYGGEEGVGVFGHVGVGVVSRRRCWVAEFISTCSSPVCEIRVLIIDDDLVTHESAYCSISSRNTGNFH